MKKSLLLLISLCPLLFGLASCNSEGTDTAEDDILAQNAGKFGKKSSDVSLYFGAGEIVHCLRNFP
jgi:hypothetical protein